MVQRQPLHETGRKKKKMQACKDKRGKRWEHLAEKSADTFSADESENAID